MPTPQDALEEVMTIPEAAHELELPEREVRDLLQDGSLRGAKIAGRWLTTTDAVKELIAAMDDEPDDDDDDDDDEDEDEDEDEVEE